MKTKKIITLCSFLVCINNIVNAQTAASTQLASHIAQKMKDTLGLTTAQQTQLYNININLSNQKAAVRQQHTIPDSIRKYTQLVERSRDSLYSTVLPAPKYNLYLQKKRNLVSAN
jgi:hypothetical protein